MALSTKELKEIKLNFDKTKIDMGSIYSSAALTTKKDLMGYLIDLSESNDKG